MNAEQVVWVLLAVGVALGALLALGLMGHVRRLGRVRSAAAADVALRWARVQALTLRRKRTP